MKKFSLILFTLILLSLSGFAQNVDDALRYSQVFYGGTARFMSMGGAFTALGGDLSSLSQNPAGIGVFRSSEISLSPQLYHIKSNASMGGLSSDYLYNFNLNNAGFVGSLIRNTGKESGLLALNFGYAYSRSNNLNQAITIKGHAGNSSMADYWVDQSNGLYKDELGTEVPDAALAYYTWVIDTLSGYDFQYGTVFSNYGDNPPSNYNQLTTRRLIDYSGYTAEHALSLGGNISNKVFFGATLGISTLNFTSHYEHLESTEANLASGFKNFDYTYHYENTGTGVNLKLGTIIKPVESLRIGLAVHTPTYYRIREYFYDDITSKFTDQNYQESNDPNRYSYALATPFRVLAGAALQIKKAGLISVDYEFLDYGTAKFSNWGDNYDYTDKNRSLKNSLGTASNFRVGGELRFDQLYLRGGFGYLGKPFKSGDLNENMHYRSLSAGIGFREKNINIDFGFMNLKNSQDYLLYESTAGSPLALLDINRNVFTLTLGYKFGY
jgi:hypothetical protein